MTLWMKIKELYLDQTIAFHHPTYVAHLNCPVLLTSDLVGDLIASSVNTAVETWDQSTSATFIEQEMVRWICNKMKLPDDSSDGSFHQRRYAIQFYGPIALG